MTSDPRHGIEPPAGPVLERRAPDERARDAQVRALPGDASVVVGEAPVGELPSLCLARRGLIAAILWYRRHVSGRGPLRRVRCTFGHCESCSAYGLRAAREAPTVMQAIVRIRRRLRRCRDASVYALTAPDGGRALAWGDDHERPIGELVAALDAAEEQAPARATVLAARELVARWRGDLVDRMAVAAHRRGLPRAEVTLRPAPTRRVQIAGRVRRALLALPVLVVLASWLLPLTLPIAVATVAGALALAVVRPSARLAQIDRQARAAALQRGTIAA